MEKPKWLTNSLAILGSVLVVLNVSQPEWFGPELSEVILTAANSIGIAVLSVISAFGAKDELKMNNFLSRR